MSNGNASLYGVNHTYIALIPKITPPNIASEFRPTSSCNILYKLISKVLSNRLKVILDQIISPNYSVFIPRRLIIDNIMVVYEELHSMKTILEDSVESMALKLDMSKTYDILNDLI